jgi:hypothetical protein
MRRRRGDSMKKEVAQWRRRGVLVEAERWLNRGGDVAQWRRTCGSME